MNKSLITFAAASLLCAAGAANAAFSVGNKVEVSYLYPDTSTVYPGGGPVTVTAPTDSIANFVSFLNIVFTDTSVVLTTTRPAGINSVAFDGVRLVDKNQTLSFAGYVLDTVNTNYAGFTAANVSYAADTIFLNVVGLPGLTGQKIVLNAAPVPEPAGVALALTALLGLGAVARRQRQN